MVSVLPQITAASAEVALRYLGVQGAIEVRNRLILEAHAAGISQSAIAEAAGVSPQRINQLIYDSIPEENGR
jgi:hypothetical protein